MTGCGQAQPSSEALSSDALLTTNTNAAPLEQNPEVQPAFSESNNIVCTEEYVPVCGKRAVQCITTPCDLIEQTFSNRCIALAEGATDIVEGACPMGMDDF